MIELLEQFTISKIGGLLTLIVSTILFLDLRGERIQSKVRDVEIYIGELQGIIDKKITKIDENGLPPAAQEFNEIVDILEAAEKEAQTKNQKIRTNLLSQIQEEQQKHKRAQTIAMLLVLIGGVLALF